MTSPRLVLALDQGTSSSRALLFDHDAHIVAQVQRPTTQLYPEPGWVNQDAMEIWESTLACAREAMHSAGIEPPDIAAIGITNQRETLILWDRKTGSPVAPAIVWQSRQSQPQVAKLISRGMAAVYQGITGLVPDAYFTATKIAWLFETQPALRMRAAHGELCAGTVDSWLIWNLTGGGVHATDVSNASRTMLFDIQRREWCPALLDDLGIPAEVLPAVMSSSGRLAETREDLFGTPIPITGVAGDQQAALFGQTGFSPSDTKNTYGTGSFLLMNTGEAPRPSTHQLLTTIAWKIDGALTYALEGGVYVSGAAVQWLRDGLHLIDSSSDVEPLAMSVPDSGGVVFVPALTGLGAPYWDANARGTIVGLTRGTTDAHLARATLEAIAFQTRDVTDAMTIDAAIPLTTLRVDGGAARNNLLLQIQADVLGVPVIRPTQVETTALGAAFLAGLGVGFWPDQEALRATWEVDRVFEPKWSADERDSRYGTWRRAVDRARNWVIES
ncbi:MAG: glycerol kinase GlpK [Thermomicrobiales bacterium]